MKICARLAKLNAVQQGMEILGILEHAGYIYIFFRESSKLLGAGIMIMAVMLTHRRCWFPSPNSDF
jgi:hypothetical protein